MEYAEYSFVREIDIDRYDSDTGEEIVKLLTALMNTSGGLVVLYCNTQDSDKRDSWLRQLHNAITRKWISRSDYWSLVRHKYWMQDGQLRIYMFVTKSKDVITFEYNGYLRFAASTEIIMNNDEVRTVLDERPDPNQTESQMERLLNGRETFTLDQSIPVECEESQHIEYKHYTRKGKDLTFSAKNVISKVETRGELLKNVSAFANTDGGSLILGVKENRKGGCIIRGFPTGENPDQEEEELRSCLEEKMNLCTWVGKGTGSTLVLGADWDVFVYDVISVDGPLRKLIEIRVMKHRGGLFLKTPTCFRVDGSGELEQVKTFEEWRNLVLSSHPNTDRDSRTSQLQKHVKETDQIDKDLSTADGDEGQTPHQAEKGNPSEKQTSETGEKATKTPRYFDGSDIDILIPKLKLRDCCTTNMAQYIHNQQGENSWYPSSEAIEGKASCYQKLVDYINREKWHGIATVIDPCNTEQRVCHNLHGMETCPDMLCCALIISTSVRPKLICCFDSKFCVESQETSHDSCIKSALRFGRKLKREFLTCDLNKNLQSAPFYFEVLVLSVPLTGTGVVTAVWDSEYDNSQPVAYPYAECQTQFTIACNGLGEKLLKNKSPVKNRHGDFLIDHLTAEQAKVLLGRQERILVVRGGSGTGKTVVALHLVQDAVDKGYKETEILYICSSEGLKAFINYQVNQKCEVWVLTATNALSDEQNEFIRRSTKLIIVDDVHAISLSAVWNQEDTDDLYPLLFKQSKADVAIFFDPDQNYQSSFPENFDVELRDMAERIADKSGGRMSPQDITRHELKERIRNSREIHRFMQANQKQAEINRRFIWLNETEGDGVTYDFVGNSCEENALYLDAELRALVRQYGERSIVILFDDNSKLAMLRKLMKNKYRWRIEGGRAFPIQGIVMCQLDDFGGLEADVVIFVLPPSFGTDSKCHWKYMNCVSSRAKRKLQFLLPWDPDVHVDASRLEKLRMLVALFQEVSTDLFYYSFTIFYSLNSHILI